MEINLKNSIIKSVFDQINILESKDEDLDCKQEFIQKEKKTPKATPKKTYKRKQHPQILPPEKRPRIDSPPVQNTPLQVFFII